MKTEKTDMRDKELECVECKEAFIFKASEQAYFKDMGFVDPKRCPACRKKRREEKEARNAKRAGGK